MKRTIFIPSLCKKKPNTALFSFLKQALMMRKLLILLVLFSSSQLVAQEDKTEKDKYLIQFSGIVVTGDSLVPVPYTSIIIKDTYRGTMSDHYGYFSFVAQMGDTIVFSSLGYTPSEFVIPDTLTTKKYSLIHLMDRDTVELPEANIYPWPTPEQFKEAFLNLYVPDDDYQRARKNLNRRDMALRAENMPMDGSENFRFQMQQDRSRLYYSGQFPSISLMNPIAWQQFINAWKRGDYSKD